MCNMNKNIVYFCLYLLAGLWSAAVSAQAPGESRAPEQIIEPEIERREIETPSISAQDVELGAFYGVISIENFGASQLMGARLAYHITEDFFIEGVYGLTEVSDEVFRRETSQAVLDDDRFNYYNLSVGANLFPGELYLLGKWAVGTSVYLKAGVGNVTFNEEDRQSFNFGLGMRFLPLDWMALHIDMEDLVFESDVLAGQNRVTHNFMLYGSLTFYF